MPSEEPATGPSVDNPAGSCGGDTPDSRVRRHSMSSRESLAHHVAPALVAAAPGFAARLLGLSVLGGGVVGASVVVAGVVSALGAWGFLELAGLDTTATLWPGLPGGVRAEIVGAVALGALAGLVASRQRRRPCE